MRTERTQRRSRASDTPCSKMHSTVELFGLGMLLVLAAAGCHLAEAGERLLYRTFESLNLWQQWLDVASMCGSLLAPVT